VVSPTDSLGAYGHVVPRPAATVVLLRPGPDGPEVLLGHRPASMAFAPGVHVFPGGAVDPGDEDPRLVARAGLTPGQAATRLGGSLPGRVALAHHVAALRELVEEAGVLLADPPLVGDEVNELRDRLLTGESFAGLVAHRDIHLRADALVPLSRWVTPPVLPRRFDARFFAAWLPAGSEPSLAGDEVVAHAWLTPSAALQGLADGTVPMWLPTSANLQRLEHVRGRSDVEHLAPGPAGLPIAEPIGPDIVRVALPSGAGVDGLTILAYLVGGRDLIVVDPGDPSEESLLAIVEATAAEDATIGAVALTAGDVDHAGGSESLREGLGLVVHGAAGADRALPFPVETLADGVAVPGGDVRLVAVAAPGPGPDHLVLWAPASRSAFTGDLVGPPPARTIRGPHDPVAWRASLARLRSLAPRRLLPAHGEAVEGEAAVERAIAAAEVRLPVRAG
jgi:glyoxylase-like metal-dependent hydrolase (beta-lactamase superfamily II)/8-oxo-dGTP pyrophosphatase MutT (NUDIX family)